MESAASMAAYGRTSLTLPITGHSGALRMPGKAAAHWLLARCPAPFRLSGCGCYSSYKNCLGAAFDTAGADSCNVTQRIPRATWRGGVEAHALCTWYGPTARLLGVQDNAPKCPEHSGPSSLPDKAWLPPDWRARLRISSGDGSSMLDRRFSRRHHTYGSGFFGGMLFLGMALFCCLLCVRTLKARRLGRLGGAPTMEPARAVVVPTATAIPVASTAIDATAFAVSSTSAAYVAPSPVLAEAVATPLVLADSAQVGATGPAFTASSGRV